jgi:hypothetical protein
MPLIDRPKWDAPELRVIVEKNNSTHEMACLLLLLDVECVLRRTAKHRYRTALVRKSAYSKRVRIILGTFEHVPRTAVTTTDGYMISHITLRGDCNAPVTHHAMMHRVFGVYVRVPMDVCLGDTIIHSNPVEQHAKDVEKVLDIPAKERLYLSKNKLQFIAPELELLSRIIQSGIRMDPHKVNHVIDWKTSTD